MKTYCKLLISIFSAISAICQPAIVHAQDSPEVRVAGMRVIREVVGEEQGDKLVPFNSFSVGTELALLVESPKAIIKFDDKASKIDGFTDNKGTDLLVKAEGSFQNVGFGAFPKISGDGKVVLIEISGGGVPADGAATIDAKGTFVFQMASQKKAVKSEPFEFKKGAVVMVGEIEMKVNKVGKPSFGDNAVEIEFQTGDKAITMLAGVKFLDATGKELESSSAGSSSMGFGNKYTYGRSFGLKEAVSGKVRVEFEVWTDLVEGKVPFSISAGVGG